MTQTLTFGFKKKSTQTFGTGLIECIYPINAYENIITTNKEIIKIENTTIKKSLKSQFSTSLYIEKANLLVAVTLQKGELFVCPLNDLNHPLISNFQTNQVGIFHLVYSEKSSILITYGSGIKIWNFDIDLPDRRRSSMLPKVKITLRNTYLDYEASILNPPSFDYRNEYLIIPSLKGIHGYDKDLTQKVVLSKVPSNSKTAHCYIQKKEQLLIYQQSSGVLLCTDTGFVHSRFTVGNSTIIWMDCLDSENSVMMDAKGNFYLLNLKTGKSFNCYSVFNPSAFSYNDNSMFHLSTSSKSCLNDINGGVDGLSSAKLIPSRVFLLHNSDNEIALCTGLRLEIFKISIPMKLWSKNVTKSLNIRRYEKPGQAARIISFTNNSFVKMFSPKDGKNLTAATPQSASNPISYIYDRGYLVYYCKNDEGKIVKKFTETKTSEKLYMLQDNGMISIFDDNTNPCKEISQFALKASCISLCYFEGDFCYALGSLKNSEIYIVDKNDLKKLKKKFTMGNDQFCCLRFDPISNCLVCVMNKDTYLLDLTKEKIVSKLNIKGCQLVELNNQHLYYGYNNGEILFASIVSNSDNYDLELVSKEPSRLHIDAVTGFAFSSSFWVSVSIDRTVRYWDEFNNNFFTITTPYTLYGCEVINSNRDVVVGTENQLMKIDGKTVFNGEIDDYDEVLDSRDDKTDPLKELILNDLLKRRKEAEEKEQEKKEMEEIKKQQQKIEKQKKKKRKLNLSKEALEILNRLDNNEIKQESSNNQEMKQILQEEEEERKKKALDAMMGFTNKPQPTIIKQNEIKKEEIKEETEEEELVEVEEEDEVDEIDIKSPTTETKSKNKRKSLLKKSPKNEIISQDANNSNEKVELTNEQSNNEEEISIIAKIEKTFGNNKQKVMPKPKTKKKKELNVFELIQKSSENMIKVEDNKQSGSTSPNSKQNGEEYKRSGSTSPNSEQNDEEYKRSGSTSPNSEQNGEEYKRSGSTSPNSEQNDEEYERSDSESPNSKQTDEEEQEADEPSQKPLSHIKHKNQFETKSNKQPKIENKKHKPEMPKQIKNNHKNSKKNYNNHENNKQEITKREIKTQTVNEINTEFEKNDGTKLQNEIKTEMEDENKDYMKSEMTNDIHKEVECEEKCNKKDNAVISEPKGIKSKCPRQKGKSNNQNNKIMSSSGQIKKFIKQRAPTPPPVINRLFNEDMGNIRRKLNKKLRNSTRSSTPNLPRLRRFFEMPQPQYVLDYEAVQVQYQRGVVELLPLVQRINIDRTRLIQNLKKPTNSLHNDYSNQAENSASHLNNQNDQLNKSGKKEQIKKSRKNSLNVLKNESNVEKLSTSPKSLIDQMKKHVIMPIKKPPMSLMNNNGNSFSARNHIPVYKKLQQLSPPPAKPLGNLQISATVTNSVDLTPRHLFTRDRKFAPNRRKLKMIYRS